MTFSPICLSLPAVLFQSASDRRLFPVRCTKFIISNPHHSFYATFVPNIRYLAVYAILCYTDVYKTVKYFTCCFLSDILRYFPIKTPRRIILSRNCHRQKLSTCFWEQTAFAGALSKDEIRHLRRLSRGSADPREL